MLCAELMRPGHRGSQAASGTPPYCSDTRFAPDKEVASIAAPCKTIMDDLHLGRMLLPYGFASRDASSSVNHAKWDWCLACERVPLFWHHADK
jgi:hypothetical protein